MFWRVDGTYEHYGCTMPFIAWVQADTLNEAIDKQAKWLLEVPGISDVRVTSATHDPLHRAPAR